MRKTLTADAETGKTPGLSITAKQIAGLLTNNRLRSALLPESYYPSGSSPAYGQWTDWIGGKFGSLPLFGQLLKSPVPAKNQFYNLTHFSDDELRAFLRINPVNAAEPTLKEKVDSLIGLYLAGPFTNEDVQQAVALRSVWLETCRKLTTTPSDLFIPIEAGADSFICVPQGLFFCTADVAFAIGSGTLGGLQIGKLFPGDSEKIVSISAGMEFDQAPGTSHAGGYLEGTKYIYSGSARRLAKYAYNMAHIPVTGLDREALEAQAASGAGTPNSMTLFIENGALSAFRRDAAGRKQNIYRLGKLLSGAISLYAIGVDFGSASGSTPAPWTNVNAFGLPVQARDMNTGAALTGIAVSLVGSAGAALGNLEDTARNSGSESAGIIPASALVDGAYASSATGEQSIVATFTGLNPGIVYKLEVWSIGTKTETDTPTINGIVVYWPTGMETRALRKAAPTAAVFNNVKSDAAGRLIFAILHRSNPVLNAIRLTALSQSENIPESETLVTYGDTLRLADSVANTAANTAELTGKIQVVSGDIDIVRAGAMTAGTSIFVGNKYKGTDIPGASVGWYWIAQSDSSWYNENLDLPRASPDKHYYEFVLTAPGLNKIRLTQASFQWTSADTHEDYGTHKYGVTVFVKYDAGEWIHYGGAYDYSTSGTRPAISEHSVIGPATASLKTTEARRIVVRLCFYGAAPGNIAHFFRNIRFRVTAAATT